MSDCILWGGYVDPSGYGRIHTVGGRKVLAHRAAWEAERGAIPAGMCVMHKCDNPRCVNLDHLSLGTHADNMADRDAKGRTARLCGEAARGTAGRLTRREREILELMADGVGDRAIADALFISENTVRNHVRNVLDKLQARTRTEAVVRAVVWGDWVDVVDAEPCDQSGWVGTVYSGPVDGLKEAGFDGVSPIVDHS